MQQTETYKLNLMETTDTFSPAPLNENTQKLEEALRDGLEAARAEAAALDARLEVCEAHHIAVGIYTAASTQLDINLGFQPKAVICLSNYGFGGILIAESIVSSGGSITSNGFSIAAAHSQGVFNRGSMIYEYVALA